MLRRSLIALAAICLVGPLRAQEDAAPPPRISISLPGDTLAVPRVAALDPGGRLGLWTPPGTIAARWARELWATLAEGRRRRLRTDVLTALTVRDTLPVDTVAPPAIADAPEPATGLDALAQLGDLGLDLSAHLEMNLDQLRNDRCSSVDINNPATGCQSGFPTPSFDQQFRVRSGGVLSDRIYVDVDFDSEREFNANNNINVWYQGLDDEILRRVEVGDVTFRPPPFRFISGSIPANSFGIQAEAQLGPLEFRSIFAQQKGSSLRSRVFTIGETTSQPVDFEARDLDFVTGRFFFVIDPAALPGFPQVDILNIDRVALSSAQQITAVRVYRLRAQDSRLEANRNLGGIDAIATRPDSPQRVGPFSWQLLVEGEDYYLDPSATWFAMANRVDTEDFLAVSYVTAAGDTVGTFPALNGQGDTLVLIHEPRRGPEVPTFRYEMRHVYRLGGGEVVRSSIELSIRVNDAERPLSGAGTYLSLLGLATSTDPFAIDEFNRVWPRPRDPEGGAPVRDLFVVFPHLQPFADSLRLFTGERNDSLYRTPTYLLVTQGPPPRFSLQFHYEASGAGDRTSVSLGAIQVREGSERLFIGNRQLVRGRDYEVDYELGQVRFLSPDSLFFGPTLVQAQFEENQLFDVAPKSIFGAAATYDLGAIGQVHAVGIFQRERTVFTRPQLGFEPQSQFVGGVSTELTFRPAFVTEFLDRLPLVSTNVPSRLEITGEFAVSQPNPNQAGLAFVEEFEREAALLISLVEREFQLGSAPGSGRGVPASHLAAGGTFFPDDAAVLTWQNGVQTPSGILEFGPGDIDSTIVLFGTGFSVEPVLWLSLKPDTVGGAPDARTGLPRWFLPHVPGPRWRSVTRPLGGGSGLGVDLSRTEFLEFWVLEDADRTARQRNAILVFDFGAVFEDAVDFGPERFRVVGSDTVFTGRTPVGMGRLDTEKDTLTNVFNALVDDIGIRSDLLESIVNETTGGIVRDLPLCDLGGSVGLPIFPLGDLRAPCTRRNRRLNTEDLNGDNRLDLTVGTVGEDIVRYVFPVGDDRFFVRNGVTLPGVDGRPVTWRLYRIPFREDTLQIGAPNLRQIQALRLTVVTPDEGPQESEFSVALARMRLVGAPWIKRAPTPIVGLSGSQGEPRGEVVVSTVSTENADLGYTSPPGVLDQADRVGSEFEFGPQQINERSLRLLARDLRVGERAEALRRFTDEADRNFLEYARLRVWARGRGPGWEEGDLEFFVKVGRDENNFYLYRTPVNSTDWLPEIVVDLARWLTLRAQVEAAWLRGEAPSGSGICGGDPEAFVACDGPYAVHVKDPGVAPPNLARVSEVAVGMLRVAQTVVVDPVELWVDDIRLSDVVDDVGIATAVDARLAAADVAEFTFGFSRRDDRFRELGQDPTYIEEGATRFGSLVRLDKFLPESWGLSAPVNVQYVRTSNDPFYISRTDVRASALPALRPPKASATAIEFSVRRVRRGDDFWSRAFLDPLAVRARRVTSENTTSLSSATTRSAQVHVEYNNVPGARTIRGAPGFLRWLVDRLPGFVRSSDFAEALRTARLRWNPAQIRFSSTLTDNQSDRFAFRVPVTLPEDSVLRPLRSIVHTWRNDFGVALQPFSTFTVRANYATTRDLQDYGDSTSVGRLLDGERRRFLGRDVGFERSRVFTTFVSVAPVVSSWLRPRFLFSSRFALFRDPNSRTAVRAAGDSAGAFLVPQTIENGRRREIGSSLDLARLASGLTGDSSALTRLVRGLLPADISHNLERRSSFDRVPFDPSLGYQLGFGGLDDFREQDGIPATATAELESVGGTGGTRLPLGALVRVSYRTSRNTIWSRRAAAQSQVVQRSREWPSLAFSWAYSPGWLIGAVINGVSAQAQYREIKASSRQPVSSAGAGVEEVVIENNSRFLTPSLSLSWIGGITTSIQYSVITGESVTSGNVTESDRVVWGGSTSFGFRPPGSIMRLRSPIQTTVSFNASRLAVCLQRAGGEECTTVSDSRRRQFDVRMDTGFTPTLRGGATFSYVVTDQRHLSSRLSQVVFTIFADVNLFAGQLR